MGATLGDGGNDRFSRMVPGGHLLRHDDRELHPKLLCAETRRVFVERIFLQFGRLLGDDSVPGGACGDDFCWAQFGPPDGAPISRGDFFAGGRNRVFVADRASFSCRHDRAAVLNFRARRHTPAGTHGAGDVGDRVIQKVRIKN